MISATVMSKSGRATTQFSGVKAAKGKCTAFQNSIKQCANLLLKESRKIVPILSKDLYNSSKVTSSGSVLRGDFEATVSYNQPYAARQHEDLTYKHAPGKSAKYLEIPTRQNKRRFRQIIENGTRKG